MKKTFTLLCLMLMASFGVLTAQDYTYPDGCAPAGTTNPQATVPNIFGDALLDGVIISSGEPIYVLNIDGELIGSPVVGSGGTFFGALNVDDQDNDCPVYVEGQEITLVYVTPTGERIQATNSTFIGTTTTQGTSTIIDGPDGNAAATDVFDFEARFLPVSFASISARDFGGKVQIDWTTASESGNEYFEVEHATTIGEFTALGRIEGAGESSELLNYDFLHDAPTVGTNYYRIKQVDFEGTFSYSGIVPVEVATVQSEEVKVFPNPSTTGYFNLNVGSDWNVDNVNVAVMNTVGRRVMEWNQDISATQQVITTDLAAGIYLVRVEGGKRVSTKRLIVK